MTALLSPERNPKLIKTAFFDHPVPDWFCAEQAAGIRVEHVYDNDWSGFMLAKCGTVLKIRAASSPESWCVSWEMGVYDSVKGCVHLDQGQLMAAFGILGPAIIETSDALVFRYGAEIAVPGKFIRWRNCVNFPCPGTGLDGDPNFSLVITDEIRELTKATKWRSR